ncbi:MAG: hypothetical protein P8X74_00355 [Reinekea sp.]
MGVPAIFEKQIEIKLLHSASTLESPDSGRCYGQLFALEYLAIVNHLQRSAKNACQALPDFLIVRCWV